MLWYAFIHAHRERFSVMLCRVLVTDRNSYHGWVRAGEKRRNREYADQQLLEPTLDVHTAFLAYGAPRNTRELQRGGPGKVAHRHPA